MIINYLDIDGLNLRDGVNFNLTPIGLFEGDRDVIMNDLYIPGQSYSRGKTKEKKIILKGNIMGDIVSNIFKLKQYLFKDGLKKLTVGIVGMPVFYIYADIQNWTADEISPEFISCQLVAPNPFLYEAAQIQVQLGIMQSANVLTYPVTYPITYGNPTGSSGIITNLGNTKGYPIISIVGTCSNIAVTNQTTGESISCNVSLGASDTLIIDNTPSNREIYLNGVKRMDLKSGSWLSCIPGYNEFVFSRSSLESKLHCTVAFQGVWI